MINSVLIHFRNLQIKRSALARLALSPGPPSHPLHRLAHDGQTDACARILIRRVQALKNPEDLIAILAIEADAVVAHPQAAARRRLLRADLDTRLRRLAGELNGVVQIVPERLNETLRVGHYGATVDVHDEIDFAVG